MQGWISVHRKLLEDGWLQNHKQLTLWLYLLLRASHKAHVVSLNINRNNEWMTIEQELEPGQLIFGRKAAARATGMSEQNVRTIIKRLERRGSVQVFPTNNYTIISIVNWSHYQNAMGGLTIA